MERLEEETHAAEPHRRFDLNRDERINFEDVNYWVKSLKRTWSGDANLDGEFSSTDLIQVFQVGVYERDEVAGWLSGDWNGDQRFGSSDLIVAFQDGGYEAGARVSFAPIAAVPEPSSIGLILWALACGRFAVGVATAMVLEKPTKVTMPNSVVAEVIPGE